MKLFKRSILMLTMIVVSFTVFSGCTFGNPRPTQIGRPVASITEEGGRLSLTTPEINNADYYKFYWYAGPYYNNTALYAIVEGESRTLDITTIVSESQDYYFYIQAVGDGERYLDSDLSLRATYNNSNALPAPVLNISGTELNWTAVPNSDGYEVVRNGRVLLPTQDTTFNIVSYIQESVVYEFEVRALGSEGSMTYDDSLNSNIISYTEHLILATPFNLAINIIEEENVLEWSSVINASSYQVIIDEGTINEVITTSDTNDLVLTDYLLAGKEYTFSVGAIASGIFYDGEYSEELSYDNQYTLATPTIIGASRNGLDVLVAWNEALYAESYTLIVNSEVLLDEFDQAVIIYDTQILISGDLEKEEGGFDIEVYANAYGYYHMQSQTSVLYAYEGIDYLETPTDIVRASATINWSEVTGADSYVVAINNDIYEVSGETFNFENYVDDEEVVEIRIKAIGSGYVQDSEYSAPTMYNNANIAVIGYTDQYFYYNEFYDYSITTQEEMNALIAYAVSHHIEAINAHIIYDLEQIDDARADGKMVQMYYGAVVTKAAGGTETIDQGSIIYLLHDNFVELADGRRVQLLEGEIDTEQVFVIYAGNVNGMLTENEIIKYKEHLALLAYNETHALTYMNPDQDGFSAYDYTFGFTYTYGLNATRSSDDPDAYTQSEDFAPQNLSSIGRSEDYNDFAPELAIVEVEVINSDSLFMAVNSGGKPVFTEEDSQAELVYEAAKDILRDIIDENMSDYEKMLAIYEWVSYNTVYDRYVYQLSAGGENDEIIPEYRVFYLEGVILDGVAVCDGIAKTIALLGNMEGIEVVKINGNADSGTSIIGHAWNKVRLDIDGSGAEWYIIDATWGDSKLDTDSNGIGDQEYMTHNYFLVEDDYISSSHFAESTFNPICDTEFNYYSTTEYLTGYDLYITSQAELNHLVEYLVYNDIEGIDFFVGYDYGGNLHTEIQSALNNAGLPAGNYFLITSLLTPDKINLDIVYPES